VVLITFGRELFQLSSHKNMLNIHGRHWEVLARVPLRSKLVHCVLLITAIMVTGRISWESRDPATGNTVFLCGMYLLVVSSKKSDYAQYIIEGPGARAYPLDKYLGLCHSEFIQPQGLGLYKVFECTHSTKLLFSLFPCNSTGLK
jgi:hypothetical protein